MILSVDCTGGKDPGVTTDTAHTDGRPARTEAIPASTAAEPAGAEAVPIRVAAEPAGAEAVPIRVAAQACLRSLLEDEDTDGDLRITVNDPRIPGSVRGDRRFNLSSTSNRTYEIVGTYPLSNLLQELKLAVDAHDTIASVYWDSIHEPPVDRISRMIRTVFWDSLTRRIDEDHLARMLKDEKTASEGLRYLYVPHGDGPAYDYFRASCERHPGLACRAVRLPERITPEFVRGLDGRHSILTLALRKRGGDTIEGVPFVVPGGRFNEMYGWDSYFESLGLLLDGRIDLAKAMVDNFVYQIRHYGKILNANRTYYLTRSQPPFLTSMIRSVYAHLARDAATKEWLRTALTAAIEEYRSVWTSGERMTHTGLSRYHGSGSGPCPEVEHGHYDHVYAEYARRRGMASNEFKIMYESGMIREPELNAFFIHDRAVRESGHDTSYRWNTGNDRCADFVTVDLNSLLHKYEIDIAMILRDEFDGALRLPDGTVERSTEWFERAERRRSLMRRYLWDGGEMLFFDYDIAGGSRHVYYSAAAFYPLWACHPDDPGTFMVSRDEAREIIERILALLEMPGGIAASAKESRGPRTNGRPDRQWDYPFGWAPHQMIAWQALANYGFDSLARRLAYRWLYTITRNAVDYNGTVTEKYDVVERSHQVFAEYGNVGTKFQYITREGFGWTNASYQVGISMLSERCRRFLNELKAPEEVFPE